MNPEEAIEKARKLLALGQSDNEHEAALAVAQANRILARFEIELASLGTETEEDYTEADLAVNAGRRGISNWKV